jgi:Raf kinase inhibitor-like YbhB/YbcL family protein
MICRTLLLFCALLGLAASPAPVAKMSIASPAFQEGANIPSRFACDGNNVNPALKISDVPAEAKSLVLIMDDPDAPAGLFTHWLVWNLSPQTNVLGEAVKPLGKIGTNDFGQTRYNGPCPPAGTHRYVFKIFALDRELDLSPGAKRVQLDAQMRGHILAQGELMARYAREK